MVRSPAGSGLYACVRLGILFTIICLLLAVLLYADVGVGAVWFSVEYVDAAYGNVGYTTYPLPERFVPPLLDVFLNGGDDRLENSADCSSPQK